jgi:hypothetical protein
MVKHFMSRYSILCFKSNGYKSNVKTVVDYVLFGKQYIFRGEANVEKDASIKAKTL